MAADPVDINTNPLPRVAASYVAKAQQIRRVSLDLSNITSDYSYAFGDDDSGKKVHLQFRRLLTGFQQSVQLLSRVVDGTADGITAMSKQYDRVEDHNTDLATRLGKGSLGKSFDSTTPNGGPRPDNGGGGGGGPTDGGGNNNSGRH
jgi:hypothetical protein